MKYIEKIDKKIINYFNLLEPDFPEWLNDYIETDILQKQQFISVTCGTIYSNLFENNFFYSSLDHSIAVALIIWHFTHDKKQTLSGLFHDVATPAFKHCVDFLNGDYMTQESTENLTSIIINGSNQVMNLLKRDNIKLSEIDNYHIYPIADNDTPKLSSDRLEYSLSNALLVYEIADFNQIKEMYNDITIQKDDKQIYEMGFNNIDIAQKFVEMTSKLSIIYRADKTRYSMQFIADILRKLSEEGKIEKKDLYNLKESDVINIIEKSKYSDIFNIWRNAKNIYTSETEPKNVYYVHHGAKIRYIDPLINGERASIKEETIDKMIQKNLSYNMNNYVYLDFKF